MKKLICMFVVREGFLLQRLWEEFFRDADHDRCNFFYFSINAVDEPNVNNPVRFANTLNPQYGHVTMPSEQARHSIRQIRAQRETDACFLVRQLHTRNCE